MASRKARRRKTGSSLSGRRVDPQGPELGEDVPVDRVVGGRVPARRSPGRSARKASRLVARPFMISDGDRGLARPVGLDQAVRGDLDPGGVAEVVGGLAGDVAGRAVVELGGDDELLFLGPRGPRPAPTGRRGAT